MKTLKLYILTSLLISISGLQAQTDNSRFAPNLMQWLSRAPGDPQDMNAVIFSRNNTMYLSALIKVNHSVNEAEIKELGAVVGTRAGNIWTVDIPQESMLAFSQLKGIDYIELDHIVKPLTDSARFVTGVDSLHKGINIPLPLSGKNVVVGVVDEGFDYTHPAYYDTLYKNLRIKRVWNQNAGGTPPSGFNYGHELKDTGSILAQKYSSTTDDHGTSTSTIAGGSGYGSKDNSLYRGVAYDCDLVLVSKGFDWPEIRGMSITRLVDAFNYIFTYAQSVGKPAVINVSLGGWTGPHDGTSLFAQACNNLSGHGKILVFGAGNNGLNKIHLQKTFTNADTMVSTIATMPYKENYFEIWGDTGKTFCIEIGLFSKGNFGAKTQKICIDKKVHSLFLIGTDNDTSFITITSNINVLNNKPLITAEIRHKTKDSFYFSVIGNSGTIHVWDEEWGDFIGKGSWAVDGDSRYTISEMACARSIITVSAFTSKMSVKNILNQKIPVDSKYAKNKGEIALFSGIGPTTDGRMKPNISAPGCMIVSATNSYSSAFRSGGPYYYMSVSKFISPVNKRTYYYTAQAGTSVAAPMVTGIVALMLQVNPNLEPERIKLILSQTAIRDSFTTQSPDESRWGAGKINAYGAIKETIRWTGSIAIPTVEKELKVYPNPAQEKFTLEYESPNSGCFFVEVSNTLGEIIKTETWFLTEGKNRLEMILDDSKKGLYYICITGRGGLMVKKVILN